MNASRQRSIGILPLLLLLVLLAGSFSATAYSQPVSVRSTVAHVNTLAYGDIDFVNASSPKWLFTINIDVNSAATVSAVMTITMDVSLASGEFYPQASELITKPFEITSTRSITNLDIGHGKPVEDMTFTLDDAAKRRVQDIALASGALPAGRYEFHVGVNVEGNTGTDNFAIVITNPSTVELLSPTDKDPFVNSFPFFQWRGDAAKWSIAVYELLQRQTSLEEAIAGVPHLPLTATNSVSFQYPLGTARPLEPGHTYVWFVQGHVGATGGTEHIFRSELRSFTVASSRVATSDLLDQLEQALGSKYRGLFDQIRAEGLTPSSAFRLNGTPVSATDLLRVLNQLRNNPDAVSVTLE